MVVLALYSHRLRLLVSINMRSIKTKNPLTDEVGIPFRICMNAKNQNSTDFLGRKNIMSQLISANIVIQIPTDQILITKVEYEELKQQELLGTYWSMKDLEKRTSKKHEWIKDNILYQERFKKILDVDCGGFVFYPKSKGQNWTFHAVKMAKFLDKYFQEIFTS